MTWVNPVRGRITSVFGDPRGNARHSGTDIAPPIPGTTGISIGAASNGVVTNTGRNLLPGRTGEGIIIDHGGGIRTYYGHLASIGVTVGQRVTAGQTIGIMGNTTTPGVSMGIHLHFEVLQNGVAINAQPFMTARGATLATGPTQPLPEPSSPQPTDKEDDMGVIAWINNGAWHIQPATGVFVPLNRARVDVLANIGVRSVDISQADFDQARAYCREIITNTTGLNTVVAADGSVRAVK